MKDFHYAVRTLLKQPGFTVVAVLTLALGIGANTAIFSVVNALLLKPLPFPGAQQLVALGSINTGDKGGPNDLNSMSYPDFFDFRDQNRSLENAAAFHDQNFALTTEEGATSL